MASTVMGNMVAASNQIDVDVYARGDDGRGVVSTTIEYQASTSSTIVPTGTWTTDFIEVPQGQFLWTRTTFLYNDDTSMISYNVSYFSTDGATFTPSVDANGNISWSNDKGLPNPETQNIRGPQGEVGDVHFIVVEELPTTNIENDAFYAVETSRTGSATSTKWYDDYFYDTANSRWEIIGEDLSEYYDKSTIDSMLEDYKAKLIEINEIEEDIDYYMTGISDTTSDAAAMYKTGISYTKPAAAEKGEGYVDGEQITTGLYYSIS